MAEIIKGALVAAGLKEEIKERLEKLKSCSKQPLLKIISVGDDSANASYERGIMKVFDELGINYSKLSLDADISEEDFEEAFLSVNDDPSVSGILLYRPLPGHLSNAFVNERINPLKDVDCISPANWAKLCMGERDGFYPCTPSAVMEFFKYSKTDLSGKKAVIIGRSLVVGRPLVSMMIAANATVTCCNSHTKDIAAECAGADIIVTAVGKAGFLKKEHLKAANPDCMIIDVGINPKPNGEKGICGDVAFDEVLDSCKAISPVPGGVGAVTSTILAEHIVRAFEIQNTQR